MIIAPKKLYLSPQSVLNLFGFGDELTFDEIQSEYEESYGYCITPLSLIDAAVALIISKELECLGYSRLKRPHQIEWNGIRPFKEPCKVCGDGKYYERS